MGLLRAEMSDCINLYSELSILTTSMGLLRAEMSVNPTMSLKKIVTQSYCSALTSRSVTLNLIYLLITVYSSTLIMIYAVDCYLTLNCSALTSWSVTLNLIFFSSTSHSSTLSIIYIIVTYFSTTLTSNLIYLQTSHSLTVVVTFL